MAKTRKPTVEEWWRRNLTGHGGSMRLERSLLKLLPHDPRCKLCNAPFRGFGGLVMRLTGRRPWAKNPNICTICERSARKYRGGAEIEVTLLFADVRGSTSVAETMSPLEFSALMNRFYGAATRVLQTDAVIDKLVGDEVIGLYLPFVKEGPARRAIEAAQELLVATGHADAVGPWLPVGIGVHTGVAFVGIVGSAETVTDFTALGDAVNVTARLASNAAGGEILVSEAALAAAGISGRPGAPPVGVEGASRTDRCAGAPGDGPDRSAYRCSMSVTGNPFAAASLARRTARARSRKAPRRTANLSPTATT